MVRRCSVMRMPLAAHSASILVLSVAGVVVIKPILTQRTSEITAQNQRRGGLAAGPLVIIGPPRHFAKAGTVVELDRSGVVLVDFEENRAAAETCQPPQMQRQEFACQPTALGAGGDRDREDFRLVLDQSRHDEADEIAAGRSAMGDDVTVEQQGVHLL